MAMISRLTNRLCHDFYPNRIHYKSYPSNSNVQMHAKPLPVDNTLVCWQSLTFIDCKSLDYATSLGIQRVVWHSASFLLHHFRQLLSD